MSEVQRRMQELLPLLPPGHQADVPAISSPEDLIFALENNSPLPQNFLCALAEILDKAGEACTPE